MTRRDFLGKTLQAALLAAIGTWALAQKTIKKTIRAAAVKNYPGPIKQLLNIEKISKWSG
jgi:hypothetical protein